MIDFSLGALMTGSSDDIDTLCEKVQAVTMEGAAAAARALALDTIYFLTSRDSAAV